jgi:hypothetical protein
MQTKEYRTEDKSGWIRGEWDDEPDKMQWPDAATGLPCLIVRGPSGALCGYVGVSDSHPWFRKNYSDAIGECNENCEDGYHYGHRIDGAIDVHGGLTFSSMCAATDDESRHICHVPDPSEPDHVWWFGFDCAHSWDICPSYAKKYGGPFGFGADESYKNVDYVRSEVTKLAAQLATVK